MYSGFHNSRVWYQQTSFLQPRTEAFQKQVPSPPLRTTQTAYSHAPCTFSFSQPQYLAPRGTILAFHGRIKWLADPLMLPYNASSKSSIQANKNLCNTAENCQLVAFRIGSGGIWPSHMLIPRTSFSCQNDVSHAIRKALRHPKHPCEAHLDDRTCTLLAQLLKNRDVLSISHSTRCPWLNYTQGERHLSLFCHNTTGSWTLLAIVHAPHWNTFVSVKDLITLTHTWKQSSSCNKLARASMKDFSRSSSSLSWGFSVLDWILAKALFFWQGTVALLGLSHPSAFTF